MGTRADFYVGRGAEAEWLGSIAMDGYPDGHPEACLDAASEIAFRESVARILEVPHATYPEEGWPWPWEDSRTTDYAYAWDGAVLVSNFGRRWLSADEARDGADDGDAKVAVFPNMSARANVAAPGSARSGMMALVIGGRE